MRDGRKDLRVLELGSGTGLVGLTAASMLKALDLSGHVHLTDFDDQVLCNLAINVDQASSAGSLTSVASVHKLDWAQCLQESQPLGFDHRYDLVLGADIIYEPQHVELVHSAVSKLLRLPHVDDRGERNGVTTMSTPTFHLVLPQRSTHQQEQEAFDALFRQTHHKTGREAGKADHHVSVWPMAVASNVARGTTYELLVQQLLSQPPLGIQGLLRVGGANDRGVDLRGWWTRPAVGKVDSSSKTKTVEAGEKRQTEVVRGAKRPRMRLPVVVQCKAEMKKLGPQLVRELEGVAGYESADQRSWIRNLGTSTTQANIATSAGTIGAQALGRADRERPKTLALLCALSGFSDEAHNRAKASSCPISLVHLSCSDLNELAMQQQIRRDATGSLKKALGRSGYVARSAVASTHDTPLNVVSWTMNAAFQEAVGEGWGMLVKRSLVDGSSVSRLQFNHA
ncbi:hypothetical protein OIO90_001458 [Microbotryomycetes sp. JL221]|nr:hypothetical protein OIO90_001458 [Microbotryomycetes sp. JL221]